MRNKQTSQFGVRSDAGTRGKPRQQALPREGEAASFPTSTLLGQLLLCQGCRGLSITTGSAALSPAQSSACMKTEQLWPVKWSGFLSGESAGGQHPWQRDNTGSRAGECREQVPGARNGLRGWRHRRNDGSEDSMVR